MQDNDQKGGAEAARALANMTEALSGREVEMIERDDGLIEAVGALPDSISPHFLREMVLATPKAACALVRLPMLVLVWSP